MQIDLDAFTPLASLLGGALIGASAAALVLLWGRIAGISGILGGLLQWPADRIWRLCFVAGLVAAPLLWQLFAALPVIQIDTGSVQLVIAGLLVGVGTRYAAGCTSGHGVCGLSRLSLRSMVATLSFMAAGFGTVFVLRHLAGG
ncbi:YeeE/YedE family protein [Viridibacterium curvum]|uniref:YeeE/YedE family protein n=1 Tax=Viridibacterium curvum TaxID=1101404 RepID=A0ABP9R5A0_9RHOO